MKRLHIVELLLRKIYIYASFRLFFFVLILVTLLITNRRVSFLPFDFVKQRKSLLGVPKGQMFVRLYNIYKYMYNMYIYVYMNNYTITTHSTHLHTLERFGLRILHQYSKNWVDLHYRWIFKLKNF